MKNFRVLARVNVVECHLSADDWELYTDIAGADDIARILNLAVTKYARSCATNSEFQYRMHEVMCDKEAVEVGAMDSEPRHVLNRIAQEIYDGPAD